MISSSRENIGYNSASSTFAENPNRYYTLGQSRCPAKSPSDCMSDYGTRSVRDTMDWEKYVVESQNSSTMARPGQALRIEQSPVENFRYRSRSYAPDQSRLKFINDPSVYLGTQPVYPGFFPKNKVAFREKSKMIGTQPLYPGF